MTFPDMTVLKENANVKLKVDDEGQLPAYGSCNT